MTGPLLAAVLPRLGAETNAMVRTTAVATDPGSSLSSRTASVLISETIRWGPHCISTWDITLSEVTVVTSPTSRFRADPLPLLGSLGFTALRLASSASSTPSTTA